MLRRYILLPAIALIAAAIPVAHSQNAPSRQVQQRALIAVVYVEATGCSDQQPRAGTGFVFEQARQIITAHHVVGGCSTVAVTFAVPDGQNRRRFSAIVNRVYSSGDLALLQASGAPETPPLRRAPSQPNASAVHVGLGFQNGQLSADGLEVTFSPSTETKLSAFLPHEAQQELSRSNSRINTNREVLRFNRALAPGMSGGPIINEAGDVIGVVAGGLKAGTVPASWGWPAAWIASLQASNEAPNTSVAVAGTFFTLRDLNTLSNAIQARRTIRCGELEFSHRGRRSYREVSGGSDDQRRLQIITQFSRPEDLEQLQFDVWVHAPSGATAVMPAGYAIETQTGTCIAQSQNGLFRQVLWGRPAQPFEVQQASLFFETSVMLPQVPYGFGWQWDPFLTKFPLDAFGNPNVAMGPTPETRSDGLVFTRKGFLHPRTQFGFQGPWASSFETLASRNGSFMGVGTVYHEVPVQMGQCSLAGWLVPGCEQTYAQFKEWTHFIMSTQLSTYPVI
jgi:hypothetical protein